MNSTPAVSHPPKGSGSKLSTRSQPSKLQRPTTRISRLLPNTAKKTDSPILSRTGSTESLHHLKSGKHTPKQAATQMKPTSSQKLKEPPKGKVIPESRSKGKTVSSVPTQKKSRLPQFVPKPATLVEQPPKVTINPVAVPSVKKSMCAASTDEDTDDEELRHAHTHVGSHSAPSESGSDTHSFNGQAIVDGIKFSCAPIGEAEGNKLFETLAYRVKKWRFAGRYLNLDEDTLERIESENRFPIEQCYKMFATWRENFRSDATYLKLAQALKNIMREDLLPDIVVLIPCINKEDGIDSQCGAERLLKDVTLEISKGGKVDLKQVEEEFARRKADGNKHVEITLQYPPHTERPLVFILPLDDLRVLSELCLAADKRGKRHVCMSVQYLSN